ncbi:MAG TPA: hypothetical protein DCZ72_10095, partial [Armatimonadetes bacterium]|nr:hypothetical protein [Armatimonadota bacterium]
AEQQEALAGNDAADRLAAVGSLMGLATIKPPTDAKLAAAYEEVRPQALSTAMSLLDDADPKVAEAALAAFSGAVSFAEKTEDERQLDPEAYQRSLNLKRAVFNDGLPRLLTVLGRGDGDLTYFALTTLTNLAKAPVVAGDPKLSEIEADKLGRADLKAKAADSVIRVAQDSALPVDVRLLAIEAAISFGAYEQIGMLSSLLTEDDPRLKGRAALAFAQAASGLGDAKAGIEQALLALASNATEDSDVRWEATLALAALGSQLGAQLTEAVLPVVDTSLNRDPDPSDGPGLAPLEGYRTYALSAAGARAEVDQLNREVSAVATAAEEQLAADRKKGYK